MLDKTKLAFFVVETHAGWIVQADEFVYPLCSSFEDALFSAMREAQAAGLLGFASVVLARPGLGRPYEIQWTYGLDEYAPSAMKEVRHAAPSFRSEARH